VSASADVAPYPLLDEASVVPYLRRRGLLDLVGGSGEPTAREVSDGNLNSVFLVRREADRPGLAVKQALPWVRVAGAGEDHRALRAQRDHDGADAVEQRRGGHDRVGLPHGAQDGESIACVFVPGLVNIRAGGRIISLRIAAECTRGEHARDPFH